MPRTATPPRQSLAGNLALAAGVSVACAALAESFARWLESRQPAPTVERYLWDWQQMWHGEFYTFATAAVGWPPSEEINPDGLRDRAHTREKPPRTHRLVFLGDSVTYGDQLEARDAYPQVLQALLDEDGHAVEVFNVGLWGWSTRQQRIAYERIVRGYAPDQVVLAVCLNDVPELQNNLARPPAWLAWAHRTSALVRVVLDARGREIESVEELMLAPHAPHVRAAWERFFAELRALRDAVHADGAAFHVAVFPFRFQLQPDAPPPLAQREIAAWCERERVACLDLLPHLRDLGTGAFVDYDHLNPSGTRRTAEVLLGSGFVPARPSKAALADVIAGDHAQARALWRATLAHDPEPARRQAAAWRLGRLRASAAADVDALVFGLADADAGVRSEAAASLGRQANAAAAGIPALYARLSDESEAVRWAAARALAQIRHSDDASIDRLIVALSSGDRYVRGFAAYLLAEIGQPAARAVPALLWELRAGGRTRGLAARALGHMGPAAHDALPLLLSVLRGDESRGSATHALAPAAAAHTAYDPAAGLPEATGDPDHRVRADAARALGRLGLATPEVVSGLAAALEDEEDHVRFAACRALGWLGPGAQPAAAALERRLRDREPRVRHEATLALRRIRAGATAPS